MKDWQEDEFSENYLTSNYRNIKMTDVPPMWEEIERNLAPRKPRKVIPLRRLASLAAVVLAILILVPVLYVLQQGQGKKMSQSDGGFNSEAQMEDVDKMESDGNEEELYIEVSKDSDEASGAAKDQGAQSSGESDIAEPEAEELTGPEARDILQLQVQILEARTEEGQLLIIAKVLGASEVGWPKGEIVTLTCDEGKYDLTDFQGTMSLEVIMEKEENIFKILEILP